MKSLLNRGLVILLVGCFGATAPAGEDIVVVEVKGEGISPDGAKNDALRKALEQGGKAEIFSHSQAENFELVRDTIYSRAEGIITDYKILQQGAGVGGVYFCKIKAKVSKSAIATNWGAVQNVLDQIGRPGVMVCITEWIDGVTDTSSILESKIEERLLKSGFDVYSKRGLGSLQAKEAADAAAEDNIAKLQALAKDHSTQIFIMGHANANAAGVENLYGTPTAMYNGDCVVKMYYTDTARLLASESLPNWRGGARGHHAISPQAGKMALSNAGAAIIEKVYATVMKQWATAISAGGEIQLEVEGLKIKDAIKVKKMLKKIKGVEKVHYQMTKGLAKYRIVAKMTAETFVEHLVEGEWESLIEVVDLKMNRIQAKAATSP
ncbi:MAG: hypothetical protein KAV82_14250 [Phycisphaerae bacterium]|nr:hypothetical protein [Phycisphaerae bacterium]